MTKAVQTSRGSTSSELLIVTNRGGNRVFGSLQEVREFSASTSEDLALLTAIIEDTDLDPAFAIRAVGLLNDLAFQLQQAVALACETGESVSHHESVQTEVNHD